MRPSTLIIGAGQSGLAVAHELGKRALSCVVVDGADTIGDSWRRRWESLRLFTPAAHNGLPGLAFPAPPRALVSKDEFADYLAQYASTLACPIKLSTSVTRVTRIDSRFRVDTTTGPMDADSVVLATGTHPVPYVPPFATEVEASIVQLHSADYSKPSDLPPGNVLVVGSGTSGLQIALDLAPFHDVTVAGRPTPHIPDAVLRFAGAAYWALASHLLTRATPVGRKVAATFHDRGAPLISVSTNDLDRAGITRVTRIERTDSGRPVTENGEILSPTSIVWATGYRPALTWVDELPLDAHGWPISARGVIETVPGLYTVGFPFQFGLTSGLIGGVGRDAAHVATAIQRRSVAAETSDQSPGSRWTRSDERTTS